MKKKLCAMLASITMLTGLSGCSTDELAYLKLNQDLFNHTQLQASGSIELSLDSDALANFLAPLYAIEPLLLTEDEPIQTPISSNGLQEFTIDYNMNINMETLHYDFDLSATHNGVTYPIGTLYCTQTDILMSGQSIFQLFKLITTTQDIAEDSFLNDFEFLNSLEWQLNQMGMISLLPQVDLGEFGQISITPDMNMEYYKSIFDFYTNSFSGFSSNLLTKEHDTFLMRLDGTSLESFLIQLLDYISNNLDTVLGGFSNYVSEFASMTGLPPEDVSLMEAEFQSLMNTSSSMQPLFELAKIEMQSFFADPSTKSFLEGFSYEMSATPTEDQGVSTTETLSFKNGEELIFKLNTKAQTMPTEKEIIMPAVDTSFENFHGSLNSILNQFNPVNAVSFTWWTDDTVDTIDTIGILNTHRADIDLFTDTSLVPTYMEDGRLFAPLRVITENLGDSVSWNSETQSVIVTNEAGNQVEIVGSIHNDTTFIPIRDFEKLGYTVLYERLDDYTESATITKPLS